MNEDVSDGEVNEMLTLAGLVISTVSLSSQITPADRQYILGMVKPLCDLIVAKSGGKVTEPIESIVRTRMYDSIRKRCGTEVFAAALQVEEAIDKAVDSPPSS